MFHKRSDLGSVFESSTPSCARLIRSTCGKILPFQMRLRLVSLVVAWYILIFTLSWNTTADADKMKKLVKYGFAFAPFAGMVGYGHGYGHGSSSGSGKKKKKGERFLKTSIFYLIFVLKNCSARPCMEVDALADDANR